MSEPIESIVSRLRGKNALDKLVGRAPLFLHAISQLDPSLPSSSSRSKPLGGRSWTS
jgi:hypothetical protein